MAAQQIDTLGPGASIETRGFYGGAFEALDWLVGGRALSPVTATFSPQPSPGAITDERQAAHDVLYGRRDAGERPRSWYSSVDHVLSWALSDVTSWPLDLDDGEMRPEPAVRREAEILTAQRNAAQTSPALRQSIDGALAALAWLVGEDDGPMSGLPRHQGGPSAGQVDEEAELSRQRRYADKVDQDPQWNYVFGVDKALDWALSDDNVSVL